MSARPKAQPAEEAESRVRPKATTSGRARSEHDDAGFDRLVYERVRLGIMSALAVQDELTFSELKGLFAVSDGNLSAHARKLEDAKYLTCSKSFDGRRPRSVYRLTTTGRAALNRYLNHVDAVIRATRSR